MGELAGRMCELAERPGDVDEPAERTTGTESGGGFKATLSPLFLGLNVLTAPDIENSGKSGDSPSLALSSSSFPFGVSRVEAGAGESS